MKNSLLALVMGLAMNACTSGQAPTTAVVELKPFPWIAWKGYVRQPGLASTRRSRRMERVLCESTPRNPITVPLFEITDVGVENATLIYQASLQSENLDGKAFLEMWVPPSWQGRVLLPRAGSPNHGHHELDDCRDPFFPAGRANAGSDPAQPGGTGKGSSLD